MERITGTIPLALAGLLLVWAGYAQFVALPRNQELARQFLDTQFVLPSELGRQVEGTRVAVAGTLHRDGAAAGDWIAYVRSERQRDTRASRTKDFRWVVTKVERPSTLGLADKDARIVIRAAVEDYALSSPARSAEGRVQNLGFTEGQAVLVFGVVQAGGQLFFDEISGEDWSVLRARHEAVAERSTTAGIVVLLLLVVALSGGWHAWSKYRQSRGE